MSSISLCMIVKNEEQVLDRCLMSVKDLVDEIIIVDTGSTDSTKQIAQKYTNKVFDFEWCNDFSKARNFAFQKAKSEYIMWLDADDVVPKISLKQLLILKQNMDKDVYMLKYNIAFSGKKCTFSYFRERIIKNCPNCVWQGAVHECITPFGNIQRLNICIEHRKVKFDISDRNLKIYQNLAKTRQLCAREQYYFARECFDHKKYKKCILLLKKFVKMQDAWIENVIDAYYLMSICYNALDDKNSSLECLFKTFEFDAPRANICCLVGDYFLSINNFQTAIYWYNIATKCKDVTSRGGFVETKYYGYYPNLQMCVCYYKLGDILKAKKCNEKAGKCIKSQIVENNKKFFENIK